MSDYAKLGSCCQPSQRVFLDNRKFLPIDAGVYNVVFTNMMRYPGQTYDYIKTISDDVERPEDIKTKELTQTHGETYSQNSQNNQKCCGRN